MKKRLLIACLICLIAVAGNAQRKRAFMVGISHYDTAQTGYQWNNINGKEDVLLLSPILQNQGFSITTILDEQATYNNIIHQFTHFISKTKKGDIVYVHFSTHGQPIEDQNGDETDGWDEAIVPIDAYKIYRKGVYEGKCHLTDDQLNTYFKELRKKIGTTGFLYVVIDACHAGTSSRANDETVRGTNVGFTANKKIFKPSLDKKSHYQIAASAKLSNVLFVEACRADQVNREIKVNDKHYGPLSYNIAQTLLVKSLTKDASDFLNGLKATILKGGHWPNNQNMVIETSY
ncbi:MAG: caspase family protein [Prevotella sp.]|nr:caspase family protein [Prevotella sp.]